MMQHGLLADVEVAASYKLSNINRIKLENIFHRVFTPARLDLTIQDRFGQPVRPREWFLVPLNVIDEAVDRIRDGSIVDVVYDPDTARLPLLDDPLNRQSDAPTKPEKVKKYKLRNRIFSKRLFSPNPQSLLHKLLIPLGVCFESSTPC